MLARVTHLLPLICIRRQRLLPAAGRVLVRAGQKVATADVIAEAKLEPGHLTVDVARGLGVTPDKADQLVARKVGEQLAEGDVIAGPVGGIISRIVRAPKNGAILAIGAGKVTLSLEGKDFELRAGMPGTVVELVAERGAVIENYGALIQGVWGNGRFDAGIMTVAVESPTDELNSFPVGCKYAQWYRFRRLLWQCRNIANGRGTPAARVDFGQYCFSTYPVSFPGCFPGDGIGRLWEPTDRRYQL